MPGLSRSLIVLYCSDLDASRAFYGDGLGLELRPERHGSGPVHYSCDLGGLVLELYPAGDRPPTRTRLGLVVDDPPAALDRLRAAGATVRTGPPVTVTDPDGSTVELHAAG
ncbi:MAG: VOC family protein [Mycolicibacterium sp.]|nr:VOC family protein [Mycolicibacterium sp.]